MSTHNICFHREIRKICGYPLLSVAMDTVIYICMLMNRECPDQTAWIHTLSWTFAVGIWHKGFFPHCASYLI